METGIIVVFMVVFLVSVLAGKKRFKLPPGRFTVPYIGTVSFLRELKDCRIHEKFFEESKSAGRIFKFNIGSHLVVVLNGYDLIHEALVTHAESCSSRPEFMQKALNGLPGEDGIIFNEYGESWRELRRFTIQALRDFGVGKRSIEETIITELEALTSMLRQLNGKAIRIGPQLQRAVANIIFSIVFGKRYELDDPEFDHILDTTDELFSGSGAFNPAFFFPAWLQWFVNSKESAEMVRKGELQNIIREIIMTRIDDHEATFDNDNIRDFVDIYWRSVKQGSFNEKKHVTKQNMFRVIFDLFLAGTETTSTTLDWACLFAMENPDVQMKCHDEIQAEIGDRVVLYADRNKLPYTCATVLEIQRHANTAPLAAPHTATEDFVLGGFDIPKDTMIIPNTYASNMDTKYFKEPELFNPDRFLDDQGKLIQIDALIPFSVGPRVCAGETLAKMELFVMFTNLVQRFTFTREHDHVKPSLKCRKNYSSSVTEEYKVRAKLRA